MEGWERLEMTNVKENRVLSSHLAIDGPVHMHRHAVDAAQERQQVIDKLMNPKTISTESDEVKRHGCLRLNCDRRSARNRAKS
jgi:hypothetical protein